MNKNIIYIVIIMVAQALSGCPIDQMNNVMVKPDQNTTATSASALATPLPENQTIKTQLLIPKDEKTKAAIEAALPNIKKVVGIHACVKNRDGMRLLNPYVVSGENAMYMNGGHVNASPIPYMEHHDKNICVGVRSIDQFSMPALNVLQFRVVYYADDSGETRNYQLAFKRVETGEWLLNSVAG